MKSFFKLIFISLIILFLCPVNLFAQDLPIQPMPDEVLPDILNNINRDENNISTDVPVTDTSVDDDAPQQEDQDDSEINQTDTDDIDINDIDEIIDQLSNNIISCIDEYNHRLFLAEKENNRVLVFDLNPDNTLIDDIPDHVLGQPDFLTITPGITDAKFNMPQGIAYDHEDNLLFCIHHIFVIIIPEASDNSIHLFYFCGYFAGFMRKEFLKNTIRPHC